MKFLASALLALVFVPVESALGQESALDRRALESTASGPEKTAAAQDSESQDILRGFKSYYIKSDTIYLHRDTLLKELQKRGEFSAWELTATEDAKAADVVITITLPFLTWEWNYRMVYQPTGTVLSTGKVSAAVEKTAAPQLAAMIVKHIREVRPLPASFQDAKGTPPTPANSGVETGKSWKLKYLSGSMTRIPKDTSVTLTVNHEWITVRASKTDSFSVAAAKVTTVASGTQIRKAKTGWEDFWDTQCCGDGGGGAALLIAPVFLAGEGILAPVKTTHPFVNIYWQEDGVMRSAYFSAGAGDAKSLLAEVSKVSGINVVDLQELMRKRKELITEQYYRAPVVVIKRKVNVGWGSLATGTFRLISVLDEIPNVTGFAEVYFFPIRDTLDLDTGIQALAKFERGGTRLEGVLTSVSYREQNGIVMLDQIETSELILRFTPIPLGLGK